MSYYIDKNLKKYGRVETGWAQRFQADRIFNPNVMICPPRDYRDNMGRPVNHDSIITTSEGCTSAIERVKVEDYQRSNNFNMVTLNNRGIEGGYSCEDLQKANMMMAQELHSANGGLIPDGRAYYSQKARDQQWLDLGRKVRYYKCLSGM